MNRRIAHLAMPQLGLDLALRREPDIREGPVVLIAPVRDRQVVTHLNESATMHDVRVGMTLADARAKCPGLHARSADPGREQRFLLAVARQCQAHISPWVGLDPAPAIGTGGLFIDCTGCSHRLGGETQLVAAIARLLRPTHVHTCVALADTPGAAWAWTAAGPAATEPVLAPAAHRQALLPLPVAALRLPAATVGTLEYLGVTSIGALQDLPRAAVMERFGPEPGQRIDQAMGRVSESFEILPQPDPHTVHMGYAEPLATPEGVAHALRTLLDRLARHLEHRSLGARQIQLQVHRIDRSHARTEIGTARPTCDVDHLAKLFAPKLAQVDPYPGIERMQLAATETGTLTSQQPVLTTTDHRQPPTPLVTDTAPGGDPQPAGLAMLIDQLANRLGADNVNWVSLRDTHLPEKRVHRHRAAAEPAGVTADARPRDASDRPVRLFHKPESARALLNKSRRPLGREVPCTIVWRGQRHQLVKVSDRERIVAPWWPPSRTASTTRDYYRVEDTAGRRLWLLRVAPPDAPPQWWVRGIFG